MKSCYLATSQNVMLTSRSIYSLDYGKLNLPEAKEVVSLSVFLERLSFNIG